MTYDLTPNQRREVNDAVSWDSRKELAWLFQDHCPLPPEGLTERFYEAVLACARWGAEQVAYVTVDQEEEA